MSTEESPEQRVADIAAGQSPLTPQAGDEAPYGRRQARAPLERPGRRVNLIRQLARAEKSQDLLAVEYGVSQAAISQFATRHRSEIEARRQADAHALDSVWIANKESRLEELGLLFERLDTGDLEADVARAAKDLLRAAAEELGQIPNKTTVVQAQPFEVVMLEDHSQSKLAQAPEDSEQEEVDEYDSGV